LRNGQPQARAAVEEYFDALAEGLEQFRLDGSASAKPDYDDAVVKSIDDFLPYRNEYVSLLHLIARYVTEADIPDLIRPLLEKVLVYTSRPPELMQYRECDFDNFRFIAHELFLYTVAILLKAGKFRAASSLMYGPFYIPSQANIGLPTLFDGSDFWKDIASLQQRNRRLDFKRRSLQADLLKERATIPSVTFNDLVQADFVLYLHMRLAGNSWFPVTTVLESFVRAPFEIFARAQSAAYFERISELLPVSRTPGLSRCGDPLEFHRAEIANGRVAPGWVVEAFDIIEHVGAGIVSCPVDLAGDPLGFER